GVVVYDVRHMPAPRVGRRHDARDAEAVAVVAAGLVGRDVDGGCDGVRGHGRGRGDVVVVAAVFVVAPDQQGLAPRQALQGGGDDAGGEGLAQVDGRGVL